MKRLTRYLATAFLAAGLSHAAFAQSIAIKPGAGNVAGILIYDANIHTSGIGQYLARHPLPDGFNSSARQALRTKVRSATLAHLKYKPPGGQPEIAIHARSGRSIEGTIEQVKPRAPGETGSSTEAGEFVSSTEEARDLAEAIYYPSDTPFSIRARNLTPQDGWVVRPYPEATGTVIHGADAELKGLRTLESKLIENPALRGGELTGYVSQTVCHSCRRVFDDFAEEYGVHGNIYYLDEVASDSASHQAAAALKDARTKLAAGLARETTDASYETERWATEYDADRIADAEVGSLTASEACP